MNHLKKVFLVVWICVLSQFCIGSKDSSSPSYLSLAGLLTSSSSEEAQAPTSASGPPPYGNQPQGTTPTTAGVPASVMAKPNIMTGYQTNLNVLDLLGIFYHKNPNFPEVRQITDVSVVKLNKDLEKSEQLDWDFNQFILDGKMGLILFTRGLQQLDYAQNVELKGAKQISVQVNGKIAILDANGNINLCYSFDGNSVTRNPSCNATALSSVKIAPHLKDSFISFDASGNFSSIHSITSEIKTLDFRKPLPNPVSVSTGEDVILIIYNGGSSIIAFLDTGVDSNSRFEEKANTNLIQIAKDGDLNNLTQPLQVTSIVRSFEGRYYAYTPTLNALIAFDPTLKVQNGIWEFPSLPIPFFRMKNVKGLQMHPNSRLIHVYSAIAIHTMSETDMSERYDLTRYVPTPLQIVLTTIASDVNEQTFDPRKDLFQYSNVKQVLQNSFNNL